MYNYDIFVSYKHNTYYENWIFDSFLPLLTKMLLESIKGTEPRIFIDKDSIIKGSDWKQKLSEAIAYSKCMVAIWSPSYFKSDFCLFEYSSMRAKKNDLIIPFTVHDGKDFPDDAKNIQQIECQNYARTAEYFKKSKEYYEFECKMLKWSEQIADRIESAPNFDREWLKITKQNLIKLKELENNYKTIF